MLLAVIGAESVIRLINTIITVGEPAGDRRLRTSLFLTVPPLRGIVIAVHIYHNSITFCSGRKHRVIISLLSTARAPYRMARTRLLGRKS